MKTFSDLMEGKKKNTITIYQLTRFGLSKIETKARYRRVGFLHSEAIVLDVFTPQRICFKKGVDDIKSSKWYDSGSLLSVNDYTGSFFADLSLAEEALEEMFELIRKKSYCEIYDTEVSKKFSKGDLVIYEDNDPNSKFIFHYAEDGKVYGISPRNGEMMNFTQSKTLLEHWKKIGNDILVGSKVQ